MHNSNGQVQLQLPWKIRRSIVKPVQMEEYWPWTLNNRKLGKKNKQKTNGKEAFLFWFNGFLTELQLKAVSIILIAWTGPLSEKY